MQLDWLKFLGAMLLDILLAGFRKATNPELGIVFFGTDRLHRQDCRCLLLL